LVNAIKYLSKENLDKALENASVKQRDWMILKTFFFTGLRANELCNLKVKNVHLSEKYLYVKGKGGKIRSVDISTDLANLLSLWINQNKLYKNDLVFNVRYHTVYRIARLYADSNPHAFRHTYAINLLRACMNIRYVQKQLGHTNLNNTQIYLQYIDYAKEKRKLSNLYSESLGE